jgi:hypothetical protein
VKQVDVGLYKQGNAANANKLSIDVHVMRMMVTYDTSMWQLHGWYITYNNVCHATNGLPLFLPRNMAAPLMTLGLCSFPLLLIWQGV